MEKLISIFPIFIFKKERMNNTSKQTLYVVWWTHSWCKIYLDGDFYPMLS